MWSYGSSSYCVYLLSLHAQVWEEQTPFEFISRCFVFIFGSERQLEISRIINKHLNIT